MAFPGYPLDTTRTNSTPMSDRHPLDHEQERTALNDLQAQIDATNLNLSTFNGRITQNEIDIVSLQNDLTAVENALARTQVTLSGASQTLAAGPGVYTTAVFTAVGVEAGGDFITVPSSTITVPTAGTYLVTFRALRGTGNFGSSNVVLTIVGSATYHYPPAGTNNTTIAWAGLLSAGHEITFDVLNPGVASTITTLAQVVRLSYL